MTVDNWQLRRFSSLCSEKLRIDLYIEKRGISNSKPPDEQLALLV